MFVTQPIAQARYDICKACEHFNNTLYICKQCGCLMKMKVKLENSSCPINKWQSTAGEQV
jgi:hypothetical protein